MAKIRIAISKQIRDGDRRQGSELTVEDVGTLLSYGEGFGFVQKGDVGKRVWCSRDNVLSMENNEQRDKRHAGVPKRKAKWRLPK